MKHKIIIHFFCNSLFFLIFLNIAFSDTKSGNITINVLENQSIRDISKKYLNDPDLWTDILTANHLTSAHEIKPGIQLIIPIRDIETAHNLLQLSQEAIKKATSQGARIFAPRIISDAIQKRNQAILHRKEGDFQSCKQLCEKAFTLAEKAIAICLNSQNSPAEAIVSYRQGDVHQRKPTDNIWKNVQTYDLLQENDRIRTLSNSFSEILFKDNSRIQLKQNAQALIRKIRSNLLNNSQESSVKLINGDILALLSGKRNNQFDIQLTNVETSIRSRHFWVSRDKKSTRIANYDGEIDIDSAGVRVVLEKDQGTIVPDQQKPQRPSPLLLPPQLKKPVKGAEIFTPNVTLEWEPVKNAYSYILELSHNNTFSSVFMTQNIDVTFFQIPSDLEQGTYYWRVISVSQNYLPGRPSQNYYFHLIIDKHPPYLLVNQPSDDIVVSSANFLISGVTEKGVQLYNGNQTIPLKADGSFAFTIHLNSGINLVSIKAIDHSGNESIVQRTIKRTLADIELEFSDNLKQKKPGHFLSRSKNFSLSGKTLPLSAVKVQSISITNQPPVSTIANTKGIFNVALDMEQSIQSFNISIRSESGKLLKETFTVEIDQTSPELIFNKTIPIKTNQEKILISGHVSDGDVEINHKPVVLTNHQFNHSFLLIDGNNTIQINVTDEVGNETIVKKAVFLDRHAPEIKKYQLSASKKIKGGDILNINILASDETSLQQTAPFTIIIDNSELSGFLKLSDHKENYTGSLYVPETIHGNIQKLYITLSDYLGNKKTHTIDK